MCEGSAPGYGQCEKQRIEARVVEPLAKITAGRYEDTFLAVWHGLQGFGHLTALLGSHPPFQDYDVLGELGKAGRNRLKVVPCVR
jgi:hypothetical protein